MGLLSRGTDLGKRRSKRATPMKRQHREMELPYNPFAQPVAYEIPLPPMAAAAMAVMKHKTLEDALQSGAAAADILTVLWGSPDADATALLLTPDAQKCTPWLWLFSRQPVWKPRKAAAPIPLAPTWFLVQTPDKKRRLHFVEAGYLRRTLHIKGKTLQEAAAVGLPAATVGFVSPKKFAFYMDGKLAGTVLELATGSSGSVLPSVPKVNA